MLYKPKRKLLNSALHDLYKTRYFMNISNPLKRLFLICIKYFTHLIHVAKFQSANIHLINPTRTLPE